jgi:hypothetical protein
VRLRDGVVVDEVVLGDGGPARTLERISRLAP